MLLAFIGLGLQDGRLADGGHDRKRAGRGNERVLRGLPLRVCVDYFQGVAPELHRLEDETDGLWGSPCSSNDYRDSVENPFKNALLNVQRFDTVVVQLSSVALDEPDLDDDSSGSNCELGGQVPLQCQKGGNRKQQQND